MQIVFIDDNLHKILKYFKMSSGEHFTQVLSVNLHYQASDTRSRERKFLVKKKEYYLVVSNIMFPILLLYSKMFS